MSTKAGELLQLFLALDKEEQDAFLNMLKGLGGKRKAPKEQIDPDTPSTRLYSHISGAYQAASGAKLKPLQVLRSVEPKVDEVLQGAVRWLFNGKEEVPRNLESALFLLAATALVLERKTRNGFSDLKATVQSLGDITEAVELAFPGYHRSGLLHSVALSVAKGKLPAIETLGE